jgi:hypothetical protein
MKKGRQLSEPPASLSPHTVRPTPQEIPELSDPTVPRHHRWRPWDFPMDEVKRLRDEGHSIYGIEAITGISYSTIIRHLKEAGAYEPKRQRRRSTRPANETPSDPERNPAEVLPDGHPAERNGDRQVVAPTGYPDTAPHSAEPVQTHWLTTKPAYRCSKVPLPPCKRRPSNPSPCRAVSMHCPVQSQCRHGTTQRMPSPSAGISGSPVDLSGGLRRRRKRPAWRRVNSSSGA